MSDKIFVEKFHGTARRASAIRSQEVCHIMKRSRIVVAIIATLVASFALAQDAKLGGTWNAKTVSPRGTTEQTITIKQTGKTFTGEMTTSQGTKEAIKDGKVNGNQIEFNVERKQANGEMAMVLYKGTVKGDEITGTFIGASGREVEWTATRGN